jgi:hypothetical protein
VQKDLAIERILISGYIYESHVLRSVGDLDLEKGEEVELGS